jgi:hypothetical protein
MTSAKGKEHALSVLARRWRQGRERRIEGVWAVEARGTGSGLGRREEEARERKRERGPFRLGFDFSFKIFSLFYLFSNQFCKKI